MKYRLSAFLLCSLIACRPAEPPPPPYALPHALNEPVVFAEGKITTTNGIAFSKDGNTLFLSKNISRTFDNGRSFAAIYETHFEDSTWTAPVPLQLVPEIDAYHPVLSMDNNTLFFNSRSHPDTIDKAIPHNIWIAKRTEQGWSTPEMIKEVNTPHYESYPSVAKNQNLYFNSDRPGGKGGMDIYVSHFINGQYQPPVNVEPVNSPEEENDLVIDPQERFLIFNRYIHSTREIDLYISIKEGEQWTSPKRLNQINTPENWELTPTLSPDGKYFFYELENKVMQIDLAALGIPEH